MFNTASQVGGMTQAGKLQTEFGLKDTFQNFFVQKIFTLGRELRGSSEQKQEAVDRLIDTFPNNINSPVWRIRGEVYFAFPPCVHIVSNTCPFSGLDPHRDTPVEILHVVLLGHVKYFWRDGISRLKDDQKATLTIRLDSFDVSGLGIFLLVGLTLVKYAGSLTGRNFRTITQVAPFVLYDLVPPECSKAWVALSHLVPLVWQPYIPNIDEHIVCILCIDCFFCF